MWQKLETTGHRLTAGRDGTKLNGKRRIVATSGGSDTTWKAGRDYVKHFLPFPCPCFSTSFFFSPFLYPVCCLESSCKCDKHLRSSQTQCLAFYFPTHISLLFPPSFLFDVLLLLVFIPCKAQFFFLPVQPVEWNVFFFWGGGLFFTLFCEPVMSFHCSVCCVERGKKWIKLGVLLSFFF